MAGVAGWGRGVMRAAVGALLVAAALALQPAPGAAQGSTVGFLLLPVGARAVAVGGAVTALGEGPDGVWWNPASVARRTRVETAIHHAQQFAGPSDVVAVVAPWRGVGVFAVSAQLFDLGEQDVVPDEGGPPVGRILYRNVVLAGSYARTLGRVLDVGLTYKVFQLRLDCSGQCATVAVETSTSSAVDLGARLDLSAWAPVTVGVAVRNVGPHVTLNDGSESEPLPSRWQFGAAYELPELERYVPDLDFLVSADVQSPVRETALGLRVGGEATWQERVSLRGGYVFRDSRGLNAGTAGPAVGLGVLAGRLRVDIAREFEGLSADAGQPPTYLTLRYRF